MAIGKTSDFVIYSDEFFAGFFEGIVTNTAAFNEASRGALRLVPGAHEGHYQKESFLKRIASFVTRRDITSVAAATDLAMTQGENVRVKINRKIGPIAQTLDAWRKIGRDPSTMSLILGQMVGQEVLEDYVRTAIKGVTAAIRANTAMVVADTGAIITHADLATGLSKFGDQAGKIVCWVMHSKPYFDLVKAQVTPATTIFEIGSLAVREGITPLLGRPAIVVDAPDLTFVDTTTDYVTLGLTEDGVVVIESEIREIVSDVVTGLENLVGRVQGEYAFTLGVKGFTWDVTNGGAGPTDAAIATGTNWDQVATDDKQTAGVGIHTQ